jgi:hypothetical protein
LASCRYEYRLETIYPFEKIKNMKLTFDKASKYFFWIAGIVTGLAALPTMLSPVVGLKLTTGLTYLDQSPQLVPLIGHWGIMVVGIGVLLFLAGMNKKIRKTTVIYSTLEKGYMVSFAIYCIVIDVPYASNYITPLILDSLMTTGGIWYLVQSRKLKQD